MEKLNENASREVNSVYKAAIIDQALAIVYRGETRVIFTVKIQAKLRNAANPAEGTETCPPWEREVWVNLSENDEDRLAMALRDLERLGFAEDDVRRLHPDHPDVFRLVGKEVYVRCRVVGDVEYWNFAWLHERVGLEELAKAAEPLRGKIATVRKKMRDGATGKKKPAAAKQQRQQSQAEE
jgi:hypothetical protein